MTIVNTIKQIKPSIVKIGINVVQGENQQPKFVSLGSGFVISKDGYIFTCEKGSLNTIKCTEHFYNSQ